VTVSEDEECFECVIHVVEDQDDRFNCDCIQHKQNLLNVCQALMKARGVDYKWYVVEETKLRKYTTQKADADKKRFKRPDDDCIKEAPF